MLSIFQGTLFKRSCSTVAAKVSFDRTGRPEIILDMYAWNNAQQQLIKVKMDEMLHAENVRREMAITIINEVKNDPSMCALIKPCGIRAITAFALVASIGDINRFESPKKPASYIGLIPCCHQR